MKRPRPGGAVAIGRRLIASAAIGAAVVGASPEPAVAQSPIRCTTLAAEDIRYEGGSPRVVADEVAGVPLLVLLPPGYEDSKRSYPALYYLQGGVNTVDCVLAQTDLVEFTGAQPPERQAVVVLPDMTSGPVWERMENKPLAEARFLEGIVPYVEARYRVRAERQFRAISGFSAGGLGALHLAARHPDAFAAVASFSGIAHVDESDPFMQLLQVGNDVARSPSEGPAVFSVFGMPGVEPMGWHAANPVDLARNYHAMSLTLSVGTGVPCDVRDIEEVGAVWPPAFSVAVEPYLRDSARRLHEALVNEGVEHDLDAYGCGTHSYRYVERDIHRWWPAMFEAFGSDPPATFDHRGADAAFSVWGWWFEADRGRAREFLDVRTAGRAGLRLTGSGLTGVRTTQLFAPGQVVRLEGASTPIATADDRGRIAFTVDLGPPHEHEQYTIQARAAGQGEADYFRTRTVRFKPVRVLRRPVCRRRGSKRRCAAG
jgi:diacylglycerol O-acyltransferase/trehalose O-mycolyltransferase